MSKFEAQEELNIKNSKLVLCPNCENEFRVPLSERFAECEECGEEIEIREEGYPEEFVWYPGKMY